MAGHRCYRYDLMLQKLEQLAAMPRLRDIALQDPALNQFKQAVKEWTDQAIGILNGLNDEVQGLKTGSAGAVPATRTITAGSGLTGGGDLSADRTLAVGVINDTQHGDRGGGSLHAVATTSVAGFESAADKTKLDGLPASAVPTTRSVIAGTGLSGGGQLVSDVTLAVVYGGSANTACEGNDARLSVVGLPTPIGAAGTAVISDGATADWGTNFGAQDLITTGDFLGPVLDSNADTDLNLKRNGVQKLSLTGDYCYLSSIHYLVFPDDADGHIIPMMAPAGVNGRDIYFQGGYQGAGGSHGGYLWFFSGGAQLAVLTDTQFITSIPVVSASGTDLDLRAASGRQVILKLNTTPALTLGPSNALLGLSTLTFPSSGGVIGITRPATATAGGGLTLASGQAGPAGSPDGTITFKTGITSQVSFSPTLISSAIPITFVNATAAVINTSSDDLLLKRAASTKITIGAAGVTIHDALLTPVINSGSDTDLLLKRNSVTKVTIGSTGVTLADTLFTNYIDSGNASDLYLKCNGSTKMSVGSTEVAFANLIRANTISSVYGTNLLLQRYDVTKITIGTGDVTFADPVKTLTVDSGAASDLLLKYNGTTKVTVGTSDVGFSVKIKLSSTATITSGSGAPSAAEPNGSLYLRTDGNETSTLYIRHSGVWAAK